MRLGDTSLPTLCLPGPFSSDPINLLSRTRLQGQTQVRPYLWPLLKHWFSSAALGPRSQFCQCWFSSWESWKLSPVTRMSNCLSELSPGARGDSDPFIPRHYVQDHQPDRTASVRMQELGPHWRQLIIRRLRTTIRLCGRVLAENLAGTLQLTPFKVLNEERRW